MKCIKQSIIYIWSLLLLVGCSGGNSSNGGGASGGGTCTTATSGASAGLITTTNSNTVPVYIADTRTTGNYGYQNEPLVSVTLCAPNHSSSSQCQTISNILLDTGSYGLRVFASAIASNVNLSPQSVTVKGTTYNLGQCEVFGTGASWGSVETADVTLGNLTATNIPIQVINRSGYPVPSSCSQYSPDTDPCTAGYNGILGVGPFIADCGTHCNSSSTSVNPGNYFACTSSSCFNTYSGACAGGTCVVTVAVANQVSNPVGSFGTGYDNGLSITLPSVAAAGANQISGTLTFGIGSSAGNSPASSVIVYSADPNGMTDGNGLDFLTVFNSTTYGTGGTLAFIDSGSNGMFFPTVSGLTVCTNSSSLFCPATTQNLSATIKGFSGTPSVAVSFSISDANTMINANYTAVPQFGGPFSSGFDWGLPFFYNRTVYVGISGTTATFNSGTETGPYWAF